MAVNLPDGTVCPRGEQVDVDDDVAAALAPRPDFDPPATPEQPAAAAPPAGGGVLERARARRDPPSTQTGAGSFLASAGFDPPLTDPNTEPAAGDDSEES